MLAALSLAWLGLRPQDGAAAGMHRRLRPPRLIATLLPSSWSFNPVPHVDPSATAIPLDAGGLMGVGFAMGIVGALFAAFPHVYATVFSGFYTVFMLLLVVLGFRAVAIERRCKQARSCSRWKMSRS